MSEEDYSKIKKIGIEIGKIVVTYCNEEQIELFETMLKDYSAKIELTTKQQEELEKKKEHIENINKRNSNQRRQIALLEKRNKELENADLTTVYMNGFYDGEKKWKDKIREKIKELEREKNIITGQHIRGIKVYTALDIVNAEILRLQELLEE